METQPEEDTPYIKWIHPDSGMLCKLLLLSDKFVYYERLRLTPDKIVKYDIWMAIIYVYMITHLVAEIIFFFKKQGFL